MVGHLCHSVDCGGVDHLLPSTGGLFGVPWSADRSRREPSGAVGSRLGSRVGTHGQTGGAVKE